MMRGIPPALLVVLGGICAALHVGKLPPAVPALQQALDLTLVQAGFLLSLVQLAGMLLGLVAGLAADSLGLRRTMVAGLAILSLAGGLGGWAREAHELMALRAVEGFGFLLATVPAPGLIRRLVEPARMTRTLGLWGAYMPFGAALALLAGPPFIALAGWRHWWCVVAAVSAAMAAWLWLALPADPLPQRGQAAGAQGWTVRLRATLGSRGPWLVALSFAMYSGQWLAVIGFLPSMYAQAGWSAALTGLATAAAAAVNMVGNIASGRLLQRGVRPERLLYGGFVAMALGSTMAFAPMLDALGAGPSAIARYGSVLLFSMVGGLIPGTLFSLAISVAPGERTVSTTVGWMQQWSSAGQLAGPPLVAWVATRSGDWQWSWVVTTSCAIAGLVLAAFIGELLHRKSLPGRSRAT